MQEKIGSILVGSTIDANGQASVTYTDLKGKTIATALAGTSPSNVDQLTNYASATSFTVDLISNSDYLERRGNSLVTSKTFLVTAEADYVFNYSMTAEQFDAECLPEGICMDCVYDLAISLQDECGEELFDGVLKRTIGTLPADSTCGSAASYAFTTDAALSNSAITVHLTPGVYTVSKILTVNARAMEYYADLFVRQNTCIDDLDDFVTDALAGLDLSCNTTCAQCTTKLGTEETFIEAMTELYETDSVSVTSEDIAHFEDLYDSLFALCMEPCTTPDMCNLKRQLLENDLSPGGQYASIDIAALNDQYNILDLIADNTVNPNGNYKYEDDFTTKRTYTDNGQPILVEYNGSMVSPADLPVDEFIKKFDRKWLPSMLDLHPEYCVYNFECGNTIAQNAANYERDMLNTNSYDEALAAGYLNPLGNTTAQTAGFTINNLDPLFQTGGTAAPQYSTMDGYMNVYASAVVGTTYNFSMWKMPVTAYLCKNSATATACTTCVNANTMNSPSCEPYQDLMWSMFRAMYLSKRKLIVDGLLCTPTIPSGYERRFLRTSDLNALGSSLSGTAAQNQAVDQMDDTCHKTCEAYADRWIEKLSRCDEIDPMLDWNELRDTLIAVCVRGCDFNNPFGSKTVAPAKVSGTWANSFRDVLDNFGIYADSICDDNLIDFPLEYGHDYLSTNSPYADTCACHQETTVGEDTACACEELDADLKIALISTIGDMPESYKCKKCITCEELHAKIMVVSSNYPSINVKDLTATWRKIIETVLNTELSFNLTYPEYLKFMSQCLGDTMIQDSTLIKFREYFSMLGYTPGDGGGPGGESLLGGSEESGGGESLLGGGDPEIIDTCGCNAVFSYYETYQGLYPGGSPSFNDWFNTNFSTSGVDAENLLHWCEYAKGTDIGNDHWSAFSKANLEQYAAEEDLLVDTDLFPKCDPSPPDTAHYPDPDESGKIGYLPYDNCTSLDSMVDFLDGLIAGNANYAGLTAGTPAYFAQLARMLDSAYGNNNLFPDYVPIGNNLTLLAGYYFGCHPGGELPCEYCIRADEDSVRLVKAFLNQLAQDRDEGNYINTNNLNVYPLFPAYYNTKLHRNAGLPTLLKKTNISFRGQAIVFTITNLSNHTTRWELAFAQQYQKYNLGRIVSIDSVIPIKRGDCEFSEYFRIKATVWVVPKFCPSSGCYEQVEMFGYQDAIDLVGPCRDYKRLCNRPLVPPVTIPEPCADDEAVAEYNAGFDYDAYREKIKNEFRAQYIEHCLGAYQSEVFTMQYYVQEYHYTLYYYDQAGNLIQTVPPSGANVRNTTSFLDSVANARANNLTAVLPFNSMPSKYRYNSLNQLIRQQTPDAGVSDFWYDCLGRLVVSRNAKQNAPSTNKLYSYTLYDELNRIYEVGQLTQTTAMTVSTAFSASGLASWITAGTSKQQITNTFYDEVEYSGIQSEFGSAGQQFLRNRVVSTIYKPTSGGAYTHAVHYSYDLHGNVEILVREIPALSAINHDIKRIDYKYDLVSGKVNQVCYQPGKQDQYYHKYEYDADNRIVEVYTSTDARTWDKDADYTYYKHGPLARTQLGQLRVQGLDYAYTIHGWLKGVNSTTLKTNRDIGKDGDGVVTTNQFIAKDVMGFSLGYYAGDYLAINPPTTTNYFDASLTSSQLNAAADNLYNGNIRLMVTAISSFMSGGAAPLGTAYTYDQLNRLKDATYYNNVDMTNNNWQSSGGALTAYQNTFTYDANGNILTQVRKGGASVTDLDNLTYFYQAGTNKLDYLDEAVSPSNYFDDIDDQVINNYTYDEIGNMIGDAAEEIDEIEWTVYGKIASITRTSGSSRSDLVFEYSPDGHRVLKIEKPRNGSGIVSSTLWNYTYYVRDAQGNTLSTYEFRNDSIWLEELEMYGSSRLGMIVTRKLMAHNNNDVNETHYIAVKRGQKRYELSNHLGNVLTVISDKVTPVCSTGTPTSAYEADIIAAYDYSPFGAPLPDRKFVTAYCMQKDSNDLDTLTLETFASGIGSWVAINGTATHDAVNQEMDVANATAPFGAVSGSYSTTSGKVYTVSFSLNIGTCSPPQSVIVTVTSSTSATLYSGGFTSTGNHQFSFTADGSSVTVSYMVQTGLPLPPPAVGFQGCSFSLDNFKITYFTTVNYIVCNDQGNQYRFGFNGMEKDDEAKGRGNSYDFGNRIYDSRLGRWMSIDPGQRRYPDLSPYSFVGNMPIIATDPTGKFIIIQGKMPDGRIVEYKYEYVAGRKYAKDDPTPPFVRQTCEALDKLYTSKAMEVLIEPENIKPVDGSPPPKEPVKVNLLDALMQDQDNHTRIVEGTPTANATGTKRNGTLEKDDVSAGVKSIISFSPNTAMVFKKNEQAKLYQEHLDGKIPLPPDDLGSNSPMSLLAHELIHEYNANNDPKYNMRNQWKLDGAKYPYYTDKEEKYTTELTNQVNEKLKEPSRSTYKGLPARVSGPTSRIPSSAQTTKPKTK